MKDMHASFFLRTILQERRASFLLKIKNNEPQICDRKKKKKVERKVKTLDKKKGKMKNRAYSFDQKPIS